MSDLERRVECLEIDIKEIMRNHLPHIQAELAGLSITIKIFGGLITAGITALIVLGLTP